MAYSQHLYVAGETVTAATLNAATYHNWAESAVGKAAAAGDLFYATGANALARLAKGTARQVLRMNSAATAPEWAAVLSAVQTNTVSSIAVATGAFRNVVSVNITPTVAGGAIWVVGGFKNALGSGRSANARAVIGTSNGATAFAQELSGCTVMHAVANSGTSAVTCKIQCNPSQNGNCEVGWIVAMWIG